MVRQLQDLEGGQLRCEGADLGDCLSVCGCHDPRAAAVVLDGFTKQLETCCSVGAAADVLTLIHNAYHPQRAARVSSGLSISSHVPYCLANLHAEVISG